MIFNFYLDKALRSLELHDITIFLIRNISKQIVYNAGQNQLSTA